MVETSANKILPNIMIVQELLFISTHHHGNFLIIEDHWSVDKVRSFVYILLTALPLPSIYKKNKQKTQQIVDPASSIVQKYFVTW